MPSVGQQLDFFDLPDFSRAAEAFVRDIVNSQGRPSPAELVVKLDTEIGPKARWDLEGTVLLVANDPKITLADRDYLSSLLADGNLARALRGEDVPETK